MTRNHPKTAVVHLVWQGAGLGAFERFIDSYKTHDAGAPHDLIIGVKGFENGLPDTYARHLAGLAHRVHSVPDQGKDIAAYHFLLGQLTPDYADALLLNSSSAFLATNWLGHFHTARGAAGDTVVGATGSFEAIETAPNFPNPHLRTNAIFANIAFLLGLDWSDALDGAQFEAGPNSLVRQVEARGGSVRVVDRNGTAFAAPHWKDSATYRSGRQKALLVADNRTRAYADADEATKIWLHILAWTAEPAGPRPKKGSLRRAIRAAIKHPRRRARFRSEI